MISIGHLLSLRYKILTLICSQYIFKLYLRVIYMDDNNNVVVRQHIDYVKIEPIKYYFHLRLMACSDNFGKAEKGKK